MALKDDVPAELRSILEEAYTPDGVELWWVSPNRFFDWRSALDLWRDGGSERVLQVAQAVVDGAYL